MRWEALSKTRTLLSLGLLLAIATGLYNIGFVALDDYAQHISGMIPAQAQLPTADWVRRDIHPPAGHWLLAQLTRGIYFLGVEEPTWQLRLCLAVLAALGFLVTAWATLTVFPAEGIARTMAVLLQGFYFMSAFVFSRPMAESLSLPFLAVSCALAMRYWREGKSGDIFCSLGVLAAGSVFRYQIGACSLAIFVLPWLRKQYLDWIGLLITGMAAIVVSGLIDMGLGLSFHEGFLRYLDYNLHAGERHGSVAFYAPILLFVGLSLPPTLFSRFRGFQFKACVLELFPCWLFFMSFLGVHCLFPHKEDRFLIPVFPVFLYLLAPALAYFWETRRWGRLGYFWGVNTLLLVLVTSQIPQINTIQLVLDVSKADAIRTVTEFEGSLPIFPGAYSKRGNSIALMAVTAATLGQQYPWSCDNVLVVRFDKASLLTSLTLREHFVRRKEFPPALVERVLIWANPKHNTRRGTLEAWLPERCLDPF